MLALSSLAVIKHQCTCSSGSKRIPRGFNQIILQILFRRWPHANIVRFRRLGFLPTHFRRLIKRKFCEFPQQTRMRRRHLPHPSKRRVSFEARRQDLKFPWADAIVCVVWQR